MTYYGIITWFDFPATLQDITTPWDRQRYRLLLKPKAHFYIFSDMKLRQIKFLHNLYWERNGYREIISCYMNNGQTYSAVRIKVLGDHKVHFAVIYTFTGVHLTTVLVKDLFVIF